MYGGTQRKELLQLIVFRGECWSFKSNNRDSETQSIFINKSVAQDDGLLSVNPSLEVELSILAIAEESEMLTVPMVLVLMRVKSSHIWSSSHYRVELCVRISVSGHRKH